MTWLAGPGFLTFGLLLIESDFTLSWVGGILLALITSFFIAARRETQLQKIVSFHLLLLGSLVVNSALFFAGCGILMKSHH